MPKKNNDHLICFDLDGVLISSMVTANRIFYQIIEKELGLPLYEYPRDKGLMALSPEDRISLLWRSEIEERGITEAKIKNTLQRYREEKLAAGIPLLPYAKEAVELIAEHFEYLACVSSNPDQVIQDFLAQCGLLHYFTKITGIDHVHFSKPDPEIYTSTIDYFGLKPEECLTFEDSTHGIHSAKAAGMRGVGVATGLESPEELKKAGADLVLKDFSELDMAKIQVILTP